MQAIIDAACHFGSAGHGRGIGRGANGTYFIIDTRTGQIIARDLGRSDVTRFLSSRNTVNWWQSTKAGLQQIPIWGNLWAGYECGRAPTVSHNCAHWAGVNGVLTAAGFAIKAPMVVVTIPAAFVYDIEGQVHGGASLW